MKATTVPLTGGTQGDNRWTPHDDIYMTARKPKVIKVWDRLTQIRWC